MDTREGVLDERAGVTVEVDGLRGIEEHVLARINLEDEVFQRTETDFAGNLVGFCLGDTLQRVDFILTDFVRVIHHLIHQIIGINHGAFTGFHLTVREFDHTVREMHKFLTEGESETVEQYRQYLEVVLLLVAHHIDHLVDGEVLEAKLGCSDILGHVDGSAVRTEQQFLIQSVFGEVCPNRTIFTTIELSTRQTFLHFGLTLEVGVGLIIDLIERHAHALVSLVKTGVHPFVHPRP